MQVPARPSQPCEKSGNPDSPGFTGEFNSTSRHLQRFISSGNLKEPRKMLQFYQGFLKWGYPKMVGL